MAGRQGGVALITGGASGIGLATCARLTAGGWTVVSVDLRAAGAGASDPPAASLLADVGDPAVWPSLVARVEEEWGGVDAVLLNAGMLTGEGRVEQLSDDRYRQVMRVNVDHVVYGLRSAVPALRRRGGGDVVVTASLAGLMPFDADPVYTMTKHAVVGLVRAAAPGLASDGIRVNAVCPGLVDTPLLGASADAIRTSGYPLLSADDIAGAVVRVLTSGATGQAWFCQPGREPAPFRFGGIPGPRVPGAEGGRPPLEEWMERR
ncbi:MAG: dehydrogenase [Chloroflexi bacterium]|jgi:NAD(P)-dependent dehydrogenase (short-subunit alcohol dehydrogenase family)|nr:dehydrogenase [Chloroflexota bacterium]